MLSLATDYAAYKGSPEPYLKRIAEAGFKTIHWCHHWTGDFLYGDSEIEQIERWLDEYGLRLSDLHGSNGTEKSWGSADEYARLAGIELVRNRIDMTSRLGGDVVVMHAPREMEDPDLGDASWARFQRTLDALEPFARERGVRIAMENLFPSNFDALGRILAHYGPDFVGVCYDAGHGNMTGDGPERLEIIKDRLIAVHLHDNDGESDQHRPLFEGTTDWERLAGILATSGYEKAVMNIEVAIDEGAAGDEAAFLAHVAETGRRFEAMVECQRPV